MCTAQRTTGDAPLSRGVIFTEPRSVVSRSVNPSEVGRISLRSAETRGVPGSPGLVSSAADRSGPPAAKTGVAKAAQTKNKTAQPFFANIRRLAELRINRGFMLDW